MSRVYKILVLRLLCGVAQEAGARLQSSKAYLGHCADPFAFSKAAEIRRNVESPGRWDVGSQQCHSNTRIIGS